MQNIKIHKKRETFWFGILVLFCYVQLSLGTNSGVTYVEYPTTVESINSFGKTSAGGGWANFNDYPRMLGDFDGDNQIDIIGFSSTNTAISYSNGAGFDTHFQASTSFSKSSSDFIYNTFNEHPRWAGDVDGDGMDDIIGFQDDGIYVSFSLGRGNGFTSKQKKFNGFGKTDPAWSNFATYPRIVGYVDSDNMIDIVGFTSDWGPYYIWKWENQ